MKLWTIGFTKKSAEDFFETLRLSGATRLVDIRLHNVSQLAGFAKKHDLEYFLREVCDMDYEHLPLLAPSADLLDDYRKKRIDWEGYTEGFLKLMEQRQVEKKLSPDQLDGSCLLCSEDKPQRCHRRLVAEYLDRHWGQVEIQHLT